MRPLEGTSPNTTRVLRLDPVEASAFATGDLSVTDTLRASTANAEGTLQVYSMETRLERADSQDEREQILREGTESMAARIETLQTRETAARQRLMAGQSSPEEYFQVLGEVNREAAHLDRLLDRIREQESRTAAIQGQVDDLRAQNIRYRGPLKDRLGNAVSGAGESGRLFVAVSGQGVSLASMDNGVYTRETIRLDAQDDASGGLDLDAAQARITQLYPWGWPNRVAVSIRSIGADVFRFQLDHGHGSLDSLLDTSSENVYREVQTKTLSGLPTDVGASASANNTTVRVSQTYPGGPVSVAVQNRTGAPLDAGVTLNQTSLGRTGEDGRIWAISPAGNYTVSASYEDVRLNVTVRPG